MLSYSYICNSIYPVMIKKGSKLYSIAFNKCPHCHEADFFTVNNPYSLKMFAKMGDRCSNCGMRYEIETGFYFGAMYASYGINVVLFILFWILGELLLPSDTGSWWLIAFITIPSVLLVPVTYRLGRLVWINFFVKYRGEGLKRVEEN